VESLGQKAEHAHFRLIDDRLRPVWRWPEVGADVKALDAEELSAAVHEVPRILLETPLPQLAQGSHFDCVAAGLAPSREPRVKLLQSHEAGRGERRFEEGLPAAGWARHPA